MSEILLLHPGEGERVFGGMPPLGLAWVASYLESKGYGVDIVDFQVDGRTVEDVIRGAKPGVVGIAGTTHNRYTSFDIARTAKGIDDRIFTVYGGSHATFTAEDTLRNVPHIDAVAVGEGEETMFEIAEYALRGKGSLDDIRGMSFRKDGRVVHNPGRPRIEALETLPFPARHLMDIKKYDLTMDFLDVPGTSVMTSRGCPINCSYCSASAMFGVTLTLRSARNVVDEIEVLIRDFGFEGIKFFDSTLTLRKDHINSLCDEITRRKLKFPWECEVRVNTVTRDLLKKMQQAGCYYVDFGVESASPRVLKLMHKGITIEQVENVFKWTKDLGILTKVFFTFGHIEETLEDSFETIRFIDKHRGQITSPAVGVGIKIYPGTTVHRYAQKINCLPADFSWVEPYHDEKAAFLGGAPDVPVLIQPQMGYRELREIRYLLIKKKLRNPLGIARAIYDAWHKDNIKKVWTITKGMLQARFSR